MIDIKIEWGCSVLTVLGDGAHTERILGVVASLLSPSLFAHGLVAHGGGSAAMNSRGAYKVHTLLSLMSSVYPTDYVVKVKNGF